MPLVDVLIPTCGRRTGLAVTLTSLYCQNFRDFRLVISDQSEEGQESTSGIEFETLSQALHRRGNEVCVHRHLPRRGMAEQRHFLLQQGDAPYVHFVDDDVLLDPPVMGRMLDVIRSEGCGFVGCAAPGLQFLDDVRPDQQRIEVWDGPVTPEPFAPGRIPFERHHVNSAANALHLEDRLAPNGETVRYKVAWVGGANVLFDRPKLLEVGGFSWWDRLPVNMAGEEVLAQFLLIRRYGGCGILPAGTYHLGLPTNIEDRSHNAAALFEELLRESVA
jgi:hypothetical protein